MKEQNYLAKAVLAPSGDIFHHLSLWLFMRDSFLFIAVSHAPINKPLSFLSSTRGQDFLASTFSCGFWFFYSLLFYCNCTDAIPLLLYLVVVTCRLNSRSYFVVIWWEFQRHLCLLSFKKVIDVGFDKRRSWAAMVAFWGLLKKSNS